MLENSPNSVNGFILSTVIKPDYKSSDFLGFFFPKTKWCTIGLALIKTPVKSAKETGRNE